jgi:hypothetical protein
MTTTIVPPLNQTTTTWSIVKELCRSCLVLAKTAQPDYRIVISPYQKFTHDPFTTILVVL